MSDPVVVIGGGVSGLACARALAGEGVPTLVLEREARLGGLAASFERGPRRYPLGYHQILASDVHLRRMLAELGLDGRVRWGDSALNFFIRGREYSFMNPVDFIRAPLTWAAKLQFVKLVARCVATRDWGRWERVPASDWIAAWGGPAVLREVFTPLIDMKYGLGPDRLSAAWLGSRLSNREGSSKFGYMPDADWTDVLTEGLQASVRERDAEIRPARPVARIDVRDGRVRGVELEGGEYVAARAVVTTVPPPLLGSLLGGHLDATLGAIDYMHVLSCVVGVGPRPAPFRAYWLVCLQPRYSFDGVFNLTRLNPSLGEGGETVLNFFVNCPTLEAMDARGDDAAVLARFADDYRQLFGHELDPQWTQVNRIRFVSAKFVTGYRNPPVASSSVAGLYFAGNYRTYPLVTSTGSAIYSGLQAADAVLSSSL